MPPALVSDAAQPLHSCRLIQYSVITESSAAHHGIFEFEFEFSKIQFKFKDSVMSTSMVAGVRAHNPPPASSHAMCADLGGIWQLAQLAQAGHAQPGYTHRAFSHAGMPAAAPVFAPEYHAVSPSCAHLPLHAVPEQKEVFGRPVSANRKKALDLLCAALQPRDHTHELLHKAASGLGIKDSHHDNHSVQLNEVGAHSGRLRSDSSVSSSGSYCSNFSSVSAGPSMSTCAGTSTEAEVDLEAGGLRRIASTGSMQRASRAPKHAKDKRDPSNVIYPRRKVGEDVRNSNQVVVTAEVLEQVKIPNLAYFLCCWGTDLFSISAALPHAAA